VRWRYRRKLKVRFLSPHHASVLAREPRLVSMPRILPASDLERRHSFATYLLGPGHSHYPGADGSPRHQNHDDLHAFSQQRASGSPEPLRSIVIVRRLIGGSANQSWNCSDLADDLPAARDLLEGLRTTWRV
jgi:hypothetical protein